MQDSHDSLTVEGRARWTYSADGVAFSDRASRNIQIFRWLEAIQAESVTGAGEVDAEIAAELRRLDAKLSMVLDLLLDRSGLGAVMDLNSTYSLSAGGVSLARDSIPAGTRLEQGDVGLLQWYPEPRWPAVLRFVAKVGSVSPSTANFEFLDMAEPERDCLERWIFRAHRRTRERFR